MGTALAGVEARNDLTAAVRNWYANLNPIISRLPWVPVDRVDFTMNTHKYRPRSTTLNAAISATTTTSAQVADASFLMLHDVLELVDSATGSTERVQVSADPANSSTIVITRGISSTTPLGTVTSGSTINLVGNSRTGSEVDQTGLTNLPASRTQYCQTFQFPVQVGGSAETTRAAVLPGGLNSPFDFNRTMQLQNMVNDMEFTICYGIAQAPTDNTVTAKMNGLRSILTTNLVTAPTNASAYAATDLVRDSLQAARSGGGDPDLMFISTNMMSGLATWGMAVMRVPAGETQFGTPIKTLTAPFLGDIALVEAPLLKPYTVICLTSSEVYIRSKRNPFWLPRGVRGDMAEGDWIGEVAIEVVNESHHSWVEGITAFSAS